MAPFLPISDGLAAFAGKAPASCSVPAALAVAASVIAKDLRAGALAVDFAADFAALLEVLAFGGVLALAKGVFSTENRGAIQRNGTAEPFADNGKRSEEPARRSTAQG